MYGINAQGSSRKGAPGSRELSRENSAADAAGLQGPRRGLMVCDACRHRRSRCTFEMAVPVCVQCLLHGTKCTSRSTRKSKVESMKRSQRARELEAEVQRMEQILRSAGIDPGESVLDIQLVDDADEPNSDSEDHDSSNYLNSEYSHSSFSPGDRRSLDSCISLQSSSSTHTESPSQSMVIKTGRDPEGVFFGNASSYYILSQQGIGFIRDASGVTDFPDRLLKQPCWTSLSRYPWPYNFYADLFECRVYKALPPRGEVFALFKTYFSTVNRILPILHEETFMRMVEWQYTQQTCTDVARWASINALLAISLKYQEQEGSSSDKDTNRAWLYWKNAAAVYTELTLQPNGLLGIQALLAMAIFARLNSHMQLAIPFVTAAMKSAQALGLHRGKSRLDLSPSEQETRKRIWWCIYILDEGIGIKTGRGYLQHVDDIDVDLPCRDPQAPPEKGSSWNLDLFRSACSHAVLRSHIYRGLYANQAFYKSFAEVCKTAETLTAQLEEWKKENPCLSCKLKSKGMDHELEVTAHVAHKLSYLNSLALINRMPILFEIAARRRANPDQDPIEHISAASQHHSFICLHAARDSLSLLELLPWKDAIYSWTLYDHIFFATSTLFSHTVTAPMRPEIGPVDENLRLLDLSKNYFATVAPLHGQPKVAFMATMSSVMERTAKKVIDKALEEQKNIAASSRKEKQQQKQKDALTPSAKQETTQPSLINQTGGEGMQLVSESDLFNSAPFATGNLVADNNFGFNTAGDDILAQTAANFPYMGVPAAEQSMQMTEAYAQMYTDVYGYDIPSYMTDPVPHNTLWGQGNMNNLSSGAPDETNMTGDALLGYMWNNNG